VLAVPATWAQPASVSAAALSASAAMSRAVGLEDEHERAELQDRFGPRPAGMDRDATRSVLLGFAVFGLAVLLVVGLLVLVIVRLVRRGRSRPDPGTPGWGSPPPGQAS